MGCDIHTYAERRDENGNWGDLDFAPFDYRSYRTFGFLANVRNYSAVESISEARGLPKDLSPGVKEAVEGWGSDGHNHSWLSVEELLAFDYDAVTEDRRVTIANNGGCTAPPGGGKRMTFRKFLGDRFFTDLVKLQDIGAERVVFWFGS
jgi:hypothetical protein